jgi:hypothetical protein
MNSRSRFASPWVVMSTTRYFQQRLCAPITSSSSVLYSQHSECEPLSPQERLSCPSQSFSHACRVRIPDSYEHQSCVATSHMETSTTEITCLVRRFLASCTALECNHEPRNSLLSPSLSRNSAAHVVVAGFFQLSVS